MIRRPPRSTRTDTLFPYTTLFRSGRTFEGAGYDDIGLLRDIPLRSPCEHHMAPIRGVAHVAYPPGERVVGISKLARLVDAYARRLQIQERMTNENTYPLDTVLDTRDGAEVNQATTHGTLRGALDMTS